MKAKRPYLGDYYGRKIVKHADYIEAGEISDLLHEDDSYYGILSLIQIACSELLICQDNLGPASILDEMKLIATDMDIYRCDVATPINLLTEYDAEVMIVNYYNMDDIDLKSLHDKARRVSIVHSGMYADDASDNELFQKMINRRLQDYHIEQLIPLDGSSVMLVYQHPKFFTVMLLSMLLNHFLIDFSAKQEQRESGICEEDRTKYEEPRFVMACRSLLSDIIQYSDVFCMEMLEDYYDSSTPDFLECLK